MTLALFDLDNTLIAGDSDHLWGEFLVAEALVDSTHYRAENDRFYEDYKAGVLDVNAYLAFVLEPLTRFSLDELEQLHQRFMAGYIEPVMLPQATRLLDWHRQQGHRLMIVTATNDFITAPIAERLGVTELIAPIAERVDDRYTGQVVGIPSFREGKVVRLEQWLAEHNENLTGSYFYSDSFNDLPLLERVDNPVAVDPDDTLRAQAQAQGWSIISLRGD